MSEQLKLKEICKTLRDPRAGVDHGTEEKLHQARLQAANLLTQMENILGYLRVDLERYHHYLNKSPRELANMDITDYKPTVSAEIRLRDLKDFLKHL